MQYIFGKGSVAHVGESHYIVVITPLKFSTGKENKNPEKSFTQVC